jgi:hypothetical protein
MPYIIIIIRRWFDIIGLHIHALREDKIDDMKDSSYEELARLFDKFSKHRMKMLLGDFNSKEGREDIFKPTIGNGSLHDLINDNGLVNCAHPNI